MSVRDGVRSSGITQSLRKAIEDFSKRSAFVTHQQLTVAVGRAPGVISASVGVVPGAIQLDVTFDNGEHRMVSLLPNGAAFAPNGAKEISFQVEPPNLANDTRIGDLAAAIAGEIASALWGTFVRGMAVPHGHALASRDKINLSVDLRGVPLVRVAMSNRVTKAAIELLHVTDIVAEQDRLLLTLAVRGV